ncbi:N-acetylglucosaminyldiphosphodolichol N-acetylglucosaminyltransferase catalytic subunit alg13 [Xylographa opegraphella]|nr:N-acetylglucosaminyldiphosphodolichol N-acetylglucosaminyltransferase catalytic subunit alg13 [Xylographa opegraphella]
MTHPPPKKLCFLTVGATAPFDALITAALSAPFLAALRAASYTDLLLQHGTSRTFDARSAAAAGESHSITVQGFDFNREGLGREMRAAKGEGGAREGCVVSHAGSGSILDALRLAVPLVVVPNAGLLDNHQEELAAELAAQGYVVYGQLGYYLSLLFAVEASGTVALWVEGGLAFANRWCVRDLAAAIGEAEALRKRRTVWPPGGEGGEDGRGLIGVMDDEMGFVD